jgi:RHS repeat-associated protein
MKTPISKANKEHTANSLNQYTAIGAISPTYDANGNLTYDGTFTYGYDVENRLISASGAGNTVTYAYDAQGRRKKKTVNGTTTLYVTDADNREVLEYSGSSGQTQGWYAYGTGSNEVLNRIDIGNTTRQTLIPDIQGSFIGTLDSSGILTKRGYRPYGESTSTTGSMAYTGQRIDPETSGLYYYRARMYSPKLGRFVQPDPIGYAAGTNLYAYVGNDPLNRTDRWGLAADSPTQNWGSSYQVACYPLCAGLGSPGLVPPAAGPAGTPGFPGSPQQLPSSGGFEAQLGLQTGAPPSPIQQIGSWIGGFVNGAISGAVNLGNLIFSQPTPQDILMPGGVLIGAPNRGDPTTRNVSGGDQAAQAIFGQLSQGGTPANRTNYPGTGVFLPGGGFVGYRPGSEAKSGVPAIDINIPGIDIGKLHFP